jgi:glucuronoarabinoxylan endo-1,4-beta-xylanase
MRLHGMLNRRRTGAQWLRAAATAAVLGTGSVPAMASDAAVRPAQLQQRISGFGASSAWTAGDLTDTDADRLFAVDKGVGLTLLRVRIAPSGCSPQDPCELATAQKAQARGATVWATPWSPPAAWKSNGSLNYGGTLLPEHEDDWANLLVTSVQWMQSQGVTLAEVSAQNEPTTGNVNYESCVYTPATIDEFIGNHLAPAFQAAGLPTRIMAPETQGWNEFYSFEGTLVGDQTAWPSVGVVATHQYNGAPRLYAAIAQAGKELWETETADPVKTTDPGIGSALRVASMIHASLVNANVSAWHYWWINSADNQGLLIPQGPGASGTPVKRLYAMGNFSRLVRPGFYRVNATANPGPQVQVSAYYDDPSKQLVIVAINQNTTPVTQKFRLDGVVAGSWTAWVTSAASDLATPAGDPPSTAIAAASDFTYVLGAQSITTLQGIVAGSGPAVPPDPTASSGSVGAMSTPGGGGGAGCACATVGNRSATGLTAGAAAAAAAIAAASRRRRQGRRGRLNRVIADNR